jgi:hypothetical protein
MKQGFNNTVEDEIDAIRIELYEQTKDMTKGDRVAFIKREVVEGLKRHGIQAPIIESADTEDEIAKIDAGMKRYKDDPGSFLPLDELR